ncbi:MAG: hypothetical protein AAF726_23590 [Planctomycetota bacterium]
MSNRSRPAPKGPNLAPVFLAVIAILGAALAVAVMQNKQDQAAEKESAAEAAEEVQQQNNPFADIDNEPRRVGGSRERLVDSAPASLADTPLYRAAKVLADDAKALVAEAEAARKAGDEDTFQDKGRAAREKLETAYEKTSDWLIDLQERYPDDRQVARIEREMLTWDRALRKVRKVR